MAGFYTIDDLPGSQELKRARPVDEKKQSTETFPEMEAELGQQNSAAAATEAESAAALDEEIQQEES